MTEKELHLMVVQYRTNARVVFSRQLIEMSKIDLLRLLIVAWQSDESLYKFIRFCIRILRSPKK